MIEQLKQIQTHFNRASKSYDNVARAQKDAAEFLVDKLLNDQHFIPQTILDVGAGTGYISQLLLEKFPKSSFYLNDIATEMLEVCKAKFAKNQNIHYLPGNMLELDADLYDCIISNLALQWAPDLQYAINFLNSKSTNIFAFSTLLDGTFAEWAHLINRYQSIQMLDYPQAEELISLCKTLKKNDQDFEYRLMDYPISFDNTIGFMRYIQFLGASVPGNLVHLSNLKKLLKAPHQSLTVTYKIFFGIFRKVSE